ncbi:hypothetical protein LJR225_000718 [Phenylobacterium sp. LjRoot225]|uniref:hypothetical protein n=1 Tax=Phenylobacterium sp. LjRoot225 TaxID=3342285 RepID=UPI003ECF8DDB
MAKMTVEELSPPRWRDLMHEVHKLERLIMKVLNKPGALEAGSDMAEIYDDWRNALDLMTEKERARAVCHWHRAADDRREIDQLRELVAVALHRRARCD